MGNTDSFLYADSGYLPGQTIVDLGETETVETDSRRMQITATRFILPPQIYHSCRPNAYVDWTCMKLRALQPIAKGTIITYHYGTSELDYKVGAFECLCAESLCVGYFRGFLFMKPEERYLISNYISPYLRSQALLGDYPHSTSRPLPRGT